MPLSVFKTVGMGPDQFVPLYIVIGVGILFGTLLAL